MIARIEEKIQITLARAWSEDAPVADIVQTENSGFDEPYKPKMPQTPRQTKILASAK